MTIPREFPEDSLDATDEQMGRLFEAFAQAEAATMSVENGSGSEC